MAANKANGVKGFTPTEKKIMDLLSDGLPHTRHEVHACLWDELGALSSIQKHISLIRGKIRPKGKEILCQILNSRVHYRLVRLIAVE